MLKLFYCGCELLYSAAQAWLVLQISDGILESNWGKRRKETCWGILTALVALSRFWNALAWDSLQTNVIFILGVLILTAGSTVIYTCNILNALCLNMLGWGGLILCDHLVWTLISLAMDKAVGQNDTLLPDSLARGVYLLIWAAALIPAGVVLNRWIVERKRELLNCRKICPVLVISLLLSILCFQMLTSQVLGQWAIFLLCCILLYLIILISMVLEEVKIERERQEIRSSMLEHQYQELLEIHREYGILVHDVKNHMRMIGAMIEHGRTEETEAYISRILGELSKGRDVIWSTHESMNLILNMKFREAQKAQIKVECHCDDMSGLALSLVEICALFSNLLDNAIEANKKCPADIERRIVLLCARREKMLMISLSNPVERMRTGQRKRLLETTKEDGKLHGFGMLSIQKVIDNYHGHMRADVKDKEFSIVIYLAAFRE